MPVIRMMRFRTSVHFPEQCELGSSCREHAIDRVRPCSIDLNQVRKVLEEN
ncbi:hypothetical protein GPL17_07260 [Bradyrhizobium yuanmingense]|uniref:hypothetical protein n=1 Tax=Bradyrhizobium TaxID=374 RepID=UPI00136081E8|nr:MULTISPECIES: hypothetical protein [Bradyrhizobium]MVT50287.1 hypothetical protein [Bradyrhizobium yuanmingense]